MTACAGLVASDGLCNRDFELLPVQNRWPTLGQSIGLSLHRVHLSSVCRIISTQAGYPYVHIHTKLPSKL